MPVLSALNNGTCPLTVSGVWERGPNCWALRLGPVTGCHECRGGCGPICRLRGEGALSRFTHALLSGFWGPPQHGNVLIRACKHERRGGGDGREVRERET